MPPRRILEADIQSALALHDVDGRDLQRPMEPAFRGRPPQDAAVQSPRPAFALAYVYPLDGGLSLPLTVRNPDLPEHRGQVSLPGGRPKPGEDGWTTALRETEEEIGLEPAGIRRLGELAPVFIPVTHTVLHVHVAAGPDPGTLVRCPREVERIEIVSLDALVDPSRRRTRRRTIAGNEVDVPYFDVNDLFLWGATAMALSELVERLRRIARD